MRYAARKARRKSRGSSSTRLRASGGSEADAHLAEVPLRLETGERLRHRVEAEDAVDRRVQRCWAMARTIAAKSSREPTVPPCRRRLRMTTSGSATSAL